MNNPAEIIFDDQRILSLRGNKNPVDPRRPYAYFTEKERSVSGQIKDVATVFLTNSECPYKCLMCDLWKNTTGLPVKKGAIPEQLRWVLDQLTDVRHIKLYNSGNFFDSRAIPTEDYEEIASLLMDFDVVTIECHPNLINRRSLEFANMLNSELEIAIGLETVHPEILPLLNKKMELSDFRKSVKFLNENGLRTRAFILLRPPFMSEEEGVEWAQRSIDFAFDCGVECCAVIPTRPGNGAIDELKKRGHFEEPEIGSLENVLEYGINLKAGRVFADLWDIGRFATCQHCLSPRKQRLNQMNLSQKVIAEIVCSC